MAEEKLSINPVVTVPIPPLSPPSPPPMLRSVTAVRGSQHFIKRIGVATAVVMLASVGVIITGIAFLGWMWYSDASDETWLKIMINLWASRAVALTSTAIRAAVGVQTVIGFGMLASLALEKYEVPLSSAAVFSMMRVGGHGSVMMTLSEFCWPLLRQGPRSALYGTIPLSLALLFTSTFLQFMSTILLSDLKIGYLPGAEVSKTLAYDYKWKNGTDPQGFDTGYTFEVPPLTDLVWNGPRPQSWPAFAEESGEPFVHPHVSDTGKSLRAFLPFESVEARQVLRNYTGKAFVMDARVTCQKPEFSQTGLFPGSFGWLVNGSWNDGSNHVFYGNVKPTVKTPRLNVSDHDVGFWCPFSRWRPYMFGICEIPNSAASVPHAYPGSVYSGSLISEFREFPAKPKQDPAGAAFLILNVNHQFQLNWMHLNGSELQGGEWITFPISAAPYDNNTIFNISATLCFAAADTANREVNIYSNSNRTEPTTPLNTTTELVDSGFTRYNGIPKNVWDQLVPSNKSHEERNILRIGAGTKWAAPLSDADGYDGPILNRITSNPERIQFFQPYVTAAMHMNPRSGPFYGNYTAALDPTWFWYSSQSYNWPYLTGTKPWLVSLFQSLVDHGTAYALQAVLTAIAGSAYYDQLPNYDKSSNVTTRSYVLAVNPGGAFGTRRTAFPTGLAVTFAAIIFHLVLMAYITSMFALQTELSRIGDPWQAVADLHGDPTAPIINTSMSIGADRKQAKESATKRTRVGLALSEDGNRIYLKEQEVHELP